MRRISGVVLVLAVGALVAFGCDGDGGDGGGGGVSDVVADTGGGSDGGGASDVAPPDDGGGTPLDVPGGADAPGGADVPATHGAAGDPCPVGDHVNPGALPCGEGLDCIGFYLDGAQGYRMSCDSDAVCQERGPALRCFDGFCGAGTCLPACDSTADCAPWFGEGTCCQLVYAQDHKTCLPPEGCRNGDAAPGAPCTAFDPLFPEAGECGPDHVCLGAWYSPTTSTRVRTCDADADCGESDIEACFDGYCGIAWCGWYGCEVNADCAETYGEGSCCTDSGTALRTCAPAAICPLVGDAGPGEPCHLFDDIVHADAEGCQEGLSCVGDYYDGESNDFAQECETDADCGESEVQGCFDGFCGLSWCTEVGGCEANADCAEAYGEGACCLGLSGGARACRPASLCPEVGTAGPGEACAFSPQVNPDAEGCVEGLQCLGGYWDGAGTMPTVPCETDADCGEDPIYSCGDGFCGVSFCSDFDICETNADCAADYGEASCCTDIGGATACLPEPLCEDVGEQGPGEPCNWTDVVNVEMGNCQEGLTCLGNRFPDVACETDADCGDAPVQGCFDGACGVSFCSEVNGCAVNADCAADYGEGACCEEIGGNQTACLPAPLCPPVGEQGPGDPCPWSPDLPVNADADGCQEQYVCVGLYFGPANDLAAPCVEDADCSADGTYGCFGGYCGFSLCAQPCDADADCGAWGEGACCAAGYEMCTPAAYCPAGERAAGEPCDFGPGGVSGEGACGAGLWCQASRYPASSDFPAPCETAADCAEALGEAAVCKDGACLLSYCAPGCDRDADCTAAVGEGACCSDRFCRPAAVCAWETAPAE